MMRRNWKRLLAGALCVIMLVTGGAFTGISAQAAETDPPVNGQPAAERTGESAESGDEAEDSTGETETSGEKTEDGETEHPEGENTAGEPGASEKDSEKGDNAGEENVGNEDGDLEGSENAGENEEAEGKETLTEETEGAETDLEEEASEEKPEAVNYAKAVTYAASGNGVVDRLNALKNTYPDGKYWRRVNGENAVCDTPCPTHNNLNTCGYYNGGYQCWAFASKIFCEIFGQNPNIWGDRKYDKGNIRAGDYVRFSYPSDPTYGHSFVVLYVIGNGKVAVVENNYRKGRCGIEWYREVDLNAAMTTYDGYGNRVNAYFDYYCHASNYDEIVNSYPYPPDPEPEPVEMTGPFLRTIPDGVYHIITALDDDMGLDAYAGEVGGVGSKVQIYHNTESEEQVWRVKWISADKGYKITYSADESAYGLSLDTARTENGSTVALHPYNTVPDFNDPPTQTWVISEVDNGAYYTIQSRASSFYLDVDGGVAADERNVQIWKWEGADNPAQRWRFIPAGKQTIPDGDYNIMTDVSGDMCLDIQGASTVDDASAVISGRRGQKSQIFTVSYLNNGFYKIISKNSGRGLSVYQDGATRGTNVIQYAYVGGKAQQWTIRDAGGGYYYIQPRHSGHYLDVAYEGTAENTNVWAHLWTGSPAQRWKFEKPLKPKLSTPTASVPSGEVESGAKVSLSCAVEGAAIRYTLDGTNPTGESTRYTEPVTIEKDTVITAYAVKEEWEDSDPAVFSYSVAPTGEKPPGGSDEEGDTPPSGGFGEEGDTPPSGGSSEGGDTPPGGGSDPAAPSPYGEILPDDIPADGKIPEGLWVAAIADLVYTGTAIKPEPHVYDGSVRLHEKSDYTVAYKNNTNAAASTDAKAPTITVSGRGNYSGKETVSFNIMPVELSGGEVQAFDFCVKIGSKAQKPVPELYYRGMKLKNDKDFTVSYKNTSGVYSRAGEYSARITGKGNYSGERTLKLMAVEKIVKPKAVSIAKAAVTGFQKTFPYTGKACRQECALTVKTSEGEKSLSEGVDYTVQYTNNIKAGTATVTYYGKNGYTGKLKKTYQILPYDIAENAGGQFRYEKNLSCVYAKGGSQPKPAVAFGGSPLREGADYTLRYADHKAVSGKKQPSVTITGKGCFKGKVTVPFTIKAQDLSKATLMSGDVVYKSRANIYKITPKLMDLDGRMLSAGTDFDAKSVTYLYEDAVILENGTAREAGSTVEKTDIIPAGTKIRITVRCGSGKNYVGTFTGTYRIAAADIKSAKVTIPGQIYTGKEITPDQSQITVKLSGVTLNPEDYEIVRYDNNVKKGKASVTIRGKGNYGGVKTVKFSIGAKGFWWCWRK